MIFIKELFPNPPGNDADNEWIKLGNNGEETVLLYNWKLRDASGKVYVFKDGYILGNGELMVKKSETKISLGNKGDEIFLYDSEGKLVDLLSYKGEAREGAIISKESIYFSGGDNLIEQIPQNPLALVSDSIPTAFWGTTITVGLMFAFVALFVIKRMMEE